LFVLIPVIISHPNSNLCLFPILHMPS
jgi:hypothetical protein